MQGLFVREDKRKQGLGGELVDEALTTSTFTEVRTEIAMSNTISVKMHEARGFVLESTKTDKSGNVYGIFVKKK